MARSALNSPLLVAATPTSAPLAAEAVETVDYLVPEPDEDDAQAGDAPSARSMVGHIRAAVQAAEATLADFVATPAFQAALAELYALPIADRAGFVRDELIDDFALLPRGIRLPEGVEFRQARRGQPMLFSLVCHLPEALHVPWQNVTVSFGYERIAPDV